MIVDYHMHTKYSPDGSGDFSEFISEAMRKRIDEIGFSEHLLDRPIRPLDFMDSYVEKLAGAKEESPISIKLGAEIDFFPEQTESIKTLLRKYPFDYVIGSVHFLNDWPVDSFSQLQEYFRRDILQVYTEYFETVKALCRCQLFDVVGHADIVKIFGFKPDCNIASILKETADTIAEGKLCVEINTAGLVRPCKEIYPSKRFLQMLWKRDVPVTLGSDAHKPEDVGRSFEKAVDLMKEVGYTEVCLFEKRKRQLVGI